MMSTKQTIKNLQRVGHVRGIRLMRAAEDARAAHDDAQVRLETACNAQREQDMRLNDAKTAFASNPACEQVRIWLSHNITQSGTCAESVEDARHSVDQTATDKAAAILAVARHDVRSERLNVHHASVRRTEIRMAEDRAELDETAGAGQTRPW